ncbi:carbohydrate kinase [Halobacteriales archaeon QS_1_68_44]|nr:MAG: carbohydrate kinase [Halobacteriales archaeon QS_1_68_44]
MDPDVLVAGECLVDFIPDRPGALADVGRFERRAGGAPANVAVRLAGLGPAPYLWTRLGSDPFGDGLAATLSAHGLPERFVVRDPDAKTTLAFVAHDAEADREFSFYREGTADTRFRPGTVPDEALSEVDWVAAGGVCLSTEPSRTAMVDLLERAAVAGCETFFDPNARPELWDGGFPEAMETVLPLVDVLKATPEDLTAAGIEGNPEELLEATLELGPDTALLTLGADGAVARASPEAPWGPAKTAHEGFNVDTIDATGAGDAFTAGALRALADGESLVEAVAFGSAVAAAATTTEGAMSAAVDRERVRKIRSTAR